MDQTEREYWISRWPGSKQVLPVPNILKDIVKKPEPKEKKWKNWLKLIYRK